ncbi:hypothetical protein DUI87_29959 [Hirundo rustica rustica]|uniref:Uncharacterized protein n=1 Tax=Hirundo rustica rustica TaxID=333673 RepID=A0A3M0IYV0_HIRRU|nr:hypothetical protein DUI87_29959 [Hirundo rustica rustica]
MAFGSLPANPVMEMRYQVAAWPQAFDSLQEYPGRWAGDKRTEQENEWKIDWTTGPQLDHGVGWNLSKFTDDLKLMEESMH